MFLSRTHDRNKGKAQRTKRTKRGPKRAEKLHKHAHAQFAILPTDGFKLQISEQKDPVLVNIPETNSEKNVFKAFFDITVLL